MNPATKVQQMVDMLEQGLLTIEEARKLLFEEEDPKITKKKLEFKEQLEKILK